MKASRFAIATIFFIQGVVFANWVARIPAVQLQLGINKAVLGTVLLGMAGGSLLTMPLTGWMIARRGSRLVTTVFALLFGLALSLPAMMPDAMTLFFALMFFGACGGIRNIAMNTQAVAVERLYGRPIMSSFHASFSIGGMLGAAGGGWIASLGIGPQRHLLCVALVCAVLDLVASRWLLPAETDRGSSGPAFARPSGALIGLGLLAMCVMIGEGSMADWSAVYLRETLRTSEGTAAAGYTAFSLMMTLGRLCGDWLTHRLGAVMMMRLGGMMAAVGLLSGLLMAYPLAAIAGFACVGAGLAALVPIVYSASERISGIGPGVGLAAVNTMGFLGFLSGPPLIGFAAEATSLRLALGIVVITSFVIVLLARTLKTS